jgi:hypothetical protein
VLGTGGTRRGGLYTQGSQVTLVNDTATLTLETSGTTKATIDSSGNLGLGVTPSAWRQSGDKAMQIGSWMSMFTDSGVTAEFASNMYVAGSSQFLYSNTGDATRYRQYLGQHQWFTAPSGTAGDAISFSQVMTLDASGNLGVGTTSPGGTASNRQLTLVGSSTAQATFTGSGSFSVNLGTNGTISYLESTSTAPLVLVTNGSERARIDSSGNLLVGATAALTSADNRLSASGVRGIEVRSTGGATATTQTLWNNATSGDNVFVSFRTETSDTERGTISYNRTAGLTAYNTTSDYRAKDISGPVTDSGALIDSIPVYMGKMKGATQERPMFIAHEVPAYAHTGVKDAVDADGKPVYQQMDASALIPVMWAEIQSLRARVAALESI